MVICMLFSIWLMFYLHGLMSEAEQSEHKKAPGEVIELNTVRAVKIAPESRPDRVRPAAARLRVF